MIVPLIYTLFISIFMKKIGSTTNCKLVIIILQLTYCYSTFLKSYINIYSVNLKFNYFPPNREDNFVNRLLNEVGSVKL